MRSGIITLFLLIFTSAGFSQKDSSDCCHCVHPAGDEARKCRGIKRDSGYRIITLKKEEFLDSIPDGEASLKGYFKRDSLWLIKEHIQRPFGIMVREYCFWNGKLISAYERKELCPIDSIDYTRTDTSYQGWFYFEDQQHIVTEGDIDKIGRAYDRFQLGDTFLEKAEERKRSLLKEKSDK